MTVLFPCIWVLVALAGCSSPAPPDPVASFADNPDAVLEQLAQAPASVEREATLLALLDAYPQRADRLCPLMPEGPLLERCERVQRSPHLTTTAPPRKARVASRAAPRAIQLRFTEQALGRWADTTPSVGDCAPDDPELNHCLVQGAVSRASSGDIEGAAARCLASSTPRWRKDCFFATAEQLSKQTGQLVGASALCMGADRFARECHGHLLIQAHALALQDPTHAAALLQIAALRRALEDEAAEWMEMLYWCTYSHRLGERNPERMAAAFGLLPPNAHPHLHNALALAASAQAAPREALQAYLDGETPPALPEHTLARAWPVHWQEDLPGEEALPVVTLRPNGNDRRVRSPDPAIDQELALLGVMGGQDSPPLEQFVAALQHSDPLVRWTGARTLMQLSPDHPALAAARQDDDALVAQRATPRADRGRTRHQPRRPPRRSKSP